MEEFGVYLRLPFISVFAIPVMEHGLLKMANDYVVKIYEKIMTENEHHIVMKLDILHDVKFIKESVIDSDDDVYLLMTNVFFRPQLLMYVQIYSDDRQALERIRTEYKIYKSINP